MTIKVTPEIEGKVSLEIDNGDLKTIKSTMGKWKFKDMESYLKFTISVFARTENNSIWIEEKEQRIKLEPTEQLLIVEE